MTKIKKGELGFAVALPGRLGNAGLPIVVRGSDRKLVDGSGSRTRCRLSRGSYYVVGAPAERDELTDWVEVASGGSATASLSLDVDDEIGAESRFVLGSSGATPAPSGSRRGPHVSRERRAVDVAASCGPDIPGRRARVARHDRTYVPTDASWLTIESGRDMTTVHRSSLSNRDQLLLQLVVPGHAGSVIVVPVVPTALRSRS